MFFINQTTYMKVTIQKILEFHDLFPEEKELDIRNILKKYNKKHLVLSSHILSHNYGMAFIFDKNNPFFSENSQKYIPELEQRLNAYRQQQPCYCTTKTALELMRLIFSIPTNDYRNDGNLEDFEYDLFRIILQINENLMEFKSIKELDVATLTFFARFIMNDISGQDTHDIFRRQMEYYSTLAEFIEKRQDCAKAKINFYTKAGITSMSEYLKTWLALCVLDIEYQKQHAKGCPVLNLSKIQDIDNTINRSVIDFLSINLDESIPYNSNDTRSRDNNVDYRVFRAHPLIKINSDEYIIYNFPILVERLYNSLFFDIKESFDDAFNFYNREFVERTLFQPQILKCLSRKTSMFYPSHEIILSENKQEEEDKQPDFYIRENDNLILFECKAIRLNGKLKDKSDIDELLAILKNKLYCSTMNIDKSRGTKKKEEKVGVTQLVQQIKMIDEDTFKWDNNIPLDVAYYPVIVLEDPRFVTPGISYIINSWYKSLIEKELPGQMCHPIIIMSIDTLMQYSHIFRAFGFNFVFNRFFQKTVHYSNNDVTWTFEPLGDFNVFMQENYKLSTKKKKQLFERHKKVLERNSDNIQDVF